MLEGYQLISCDKTNPNIIRNPNDTKNYKCLLIHSQHLNALNRYAARSALCNKGRREGIYLAFNVRKH